MDEQDHKTTRVCIYGFMLLIFGFIGSCQLTNYRVGSAIEAGASPLAAACSLRADISMNCDFLVAAEAEATRNTQEPK